MSNWFGGNMKQMIFVFLALFSFSALANYQTFCVIEDGKAKGYVRSDESLSFSGKVYFYQYDKDGELVDEDWEIAVVILVGTDMELVDEVSADDEARFCSLDISEAVAD